MKKEQKILQGKVISDKMDKSIVVEIVKKEKHTRYKKFVNKKTKLYVHDEKNEAKIGDIVNLIETRPLSKTKRYVLKGIVVKAKSV